MFLEINSQFLKTQINLKINHNIINKIKWNKIYELNEYFKIKFIICKYNKIKLKICSNFKA